MPLYHVTIGCRIIETIVMEILPLTVASSIHKAANQLVRKSKKKFILILPICSNGGYRLRNWILLLPDMSFFNFRQLTTCLILIPPLLWKKIKKNFSETRPFLALFVKSVFSPLKIQKNLENFSKNYKTAFRQANFCLLRCQILLWHAQWQPLHAKFCPQHMQF